MEIVVADEVQTQSDDHESAKRGGVVLRKWLFTLDEPDGLRARLFRSKYQPGEAAFQSPRHHHAFQQIRWAEEGEINYGPDQDIAQGDLAYFPRGAYYGPQKKDRGVSFLIQFGFEDELPVSNFEKTATPERLAERKAADAEAMVMERPSAAVDTPPAGYEAPVLIHPKAFEYYEVAPGVELRQFGAFYDHAGPNGDIKISMARLTEGGVYSLSAERAQMGWTLAPGLEIDGKTYPELTCFFSPRGETVDLSADSPVEIHLFDFPRPD